MASSHLTCGVVERQQLMNGYGQQAMTHWQRWLPNRYSQVKDPQVFFTRLGEQAEQQIEDLSLSLEAQQRDRLKSAGYLERVGVLNALQKQATEVVMSEFLPDPEPEMLEVEDPSPDPLDQWMGRDGMPKDRSHPLWAMAEDENVSPEAFRSALREWMDQLPSS